MQDEIPAELKQEMEAAEHEATQATGVELPSVDVPRERPLLERLMDVGPYAAAASMKSPAPLPLADLRERLQLLQEASVDNYEDAGIKIHFDLENRRALLRPMGDVPKW